MMKAKRPSEGEGRFEYPGIQSNTQPSPCLECFFVRFVCFIIVCITRSKSSQQIQNPQIFVGKNKENTISMLFLKVSLHFLKNFKRTVLQPTLAPLSLPFARRS